jgi:hypothetical protein
MPIKKTIIALAKRGWIQTKPRPLFVYLLFFAYFLIWFVAFVLYLKFEMTYLKIWIIIVGILTFITFIHAIIHSYIIKIVEKEKITN